MILTDGKIIDYPIADNLILTCLSNCNIFATISEKVYVCVCPSEAFCQMEGLQFRIDIRVLEYEFGNQMDVNFTLNYLV